ncbi:hypothetical protein [Streptomyces sp. NPDC051636]|uniref:FDXHR family putative zinc-binding protein n=1 Tax=Streptomyces sp. NPDC051636 TaxID=3365663 RepID=UPI0037B29AC6
MHSHAECGKTWTGLRRAHCPACHETFNSDSAADKHRVGKFGDDRRCLPPTEAGLVATEQPWGTCWQAPGSDLRFSDHEATEAA